MASDEKDKLSEALKAAMVADMEQVQDSIYNDLVVNVENNQLPENIFVEYFLPYFSGQQKLEDNSKVIAEWISISGTPTNEVDIINRRGDVLYTVPSLFDTKVIDTETRAMGESLADIAYQYSLMHDSLPKRAEVFMSKALDNKTSIIKATDTHEKILNRWSDIFTRYGVPVNAKLSNNEQMTDDDSLQDDIIY